MNTYLKAIVASGVAGLTTLGTALADGHITALEGVGIALAALGALAAVYAVPNKQGSTDA